DRFVGEDFAGAGAEPDERPGVGQEGVVVGLDIQDDEIVVAAGEMNVGRQEGGRVLRHGLFAEKSPGDGCEPPPGRGSDRRLAAHDANFGEVAVRLVPGQIPRAADTGQGQSGRFHKGLSKCRDPAAKTGPRQAARPWSRRPPVAASDLRPTETDFGKRAGGLELGEGPGAAETEERDPGGLHLGLPG
ncbi:MAG: hypothetical protein IE935_10030, partial [Micrococcales bacterium]|nr:hypothetical protein [Micrococcales bacterium]